MPQRALCSLRIHIHFGVIKLDIFFLKLQIKEHTDKERPSRKEVKQSSFFFVLLLSL